MKPPEKLQPCRGCKSPKPICKSSDYYRCDRFKIMFLKSWEETTKYLRKLTGMEQER